jgi:hypothetical protein
VPVEERLKIHSVVQVVGVEEDQTSALLLVEMEVILSVVGVEEVGVEMEEVALVVHLLSSVALVVQEEAVLKVVLLVMFLAEEVVGHVQMDMAISLEVQEEKADAEYGLCLSNY